RPLALVKRTGSGCRIDALLASSSKSCKDCALTSQGATLNAAGIQQEDRRVDAAARGRDRPSLKEAAGGGLSQGEAVTRSPPTEGSSTHAKAAAVFVDGYEAASLQSELQKATNRADAAQSEVARERRSMSEVQSKLAEAVQRIGRLLARRRGVRADNYRREADSRKQRSEQAAAGLTMPWQLVALEEQRRTGSWLDSLSANEKRAEQLSGELAKYKLALEYSEGVLKKLEASLKKKRLVGNPPCALQKPMLKVQSRPGVRWRADSEKQRVQQLEQKMKQQQPQQNGQASSTASTVAAPAAPAPAPSPAARAALFASPCSVSQLQSPSLGIVGGGGGRACFNCSSVGCGRSLRCGRQRGGSSG
uniref:C2 domain-containing protein n=1 Tax=Macrostomum lignano TaxID=282301 RepID=A0A1I8F8Q5_9PLAT